MKAHKDDTQIRIALLEQSHANIIDTLKEIKIEISTKTIEIKEEIREVKDQIKETKCEVKSLRDHVDFRLDKINNRLWSLFFWMIGGGSSILYIIAKSNGWLR